MGNCADRITSETHIRAGVLIDELQSSGETMIRISKQVLKTVEHDLEYVISDKLLQQPLAATTTSGSKLYQYMDAFVPRISFENFQQKLDLNAAKIGLKKKDPLMKKVEDLKDGLLREENSTFRSNAKFSSKEYETKVTPPKESTPRNKSQDRFSRSVTLSCSEESQEDLQPVQARKFVSPSEVYSNLYEDSRKGIDDYRKSSRIVNEEASRTSNILNTLNMARARSRFPDHDQFKDEPKAEVSHPSKPSYGYNKENQVLFNFHQKNLNLKEVRLSNESFGPSKNLIRGVSHTKEEAVNYHCSMVKRPFLHEPSEQGYETEYDSGSMMHGDCWLGSRASNNARLPPRDNSEFYSQMSEAESHCLEWE